MPSNATLWSQLARLMRIVDEVGAGEPNGHNVSEGAVGFWWWREGRVFTWWGLKDGRTEMATREPINHTDSEMRSALRWVMGVEPCPECGGDVELVRWGAFFSNGVPISGGWQMRCHKCKRSWPYATWKPDAVRTYIEARKGGGDGK